MASLLIADSGSTKTDWCLIRPTADKQYFHTGGMNPLLQTREQSKAVLQSELAINPSSSTIDRIVFYGAGMKDEAAIQQIQSVLSEYFHCSNVTAHSDLLAAARATCGHQPGISCILGTGSNSGYYDGEVIKHQNPSLGFIIGDEGSGAFLGKRVLQYYFYRTFDEELSSSFQQQYGDNLSLILNRVYQEPFANRYLASFATFLQEHRGHYMVENILEDAFTDFYQSHVLKYQQSWHLPIHFCGSVAFGFQDVIRNLHEQYRLTTGHIIKSPIEGLCAYHEEELSTSQS